MAYLTFALYAPIGAMGAAVTGDQRMGWTRPSRSGVLGLVAGAMGLFRGEAYEERHLALEREIGMAMLVERAGRAFMDFHTIRMPAGKAGFATRAEELAAIRPSHNPVVSRREYRTDVAVLVALWLRDRAGTFSLEQIAEALRHPATVPYMGRKSCPLGLPLGVQIADAASPVEALETRYRDGPERGFLKQLRDHPGEQYIALDRADMPGQHRTEIRADRVVSRMRWQFMSRTEVIVPLTLPPTEVANVPL